MQRFLLLPSFVLILALFAPLTAMSSPSSPDAPNSGNAAEVARIKAELFTLAESFEGQGDPDFSIQRQLQPLVDELLAAVPQPPVKDRLPLLHGAWKQIWGPYDYRNDKRGVDPETTVDEIYQVVFPGGYYYNVNPILEGREPGQERIALLRGEYILDPDDPLLLRVRFTNFPGNKGRPQDMPLWELPALAEQGELPDKTWIVPSVIVKLFFGGGALREVYTDHDMRILYATDSKNFEQDYLYVMRRVGDVD